MGEEDAADPFDLPQPIPAKPKPAAVPDPEPSRRQPRFGNRRRAHGAGASAANAQRDAMRDAIANKIDEMLGTRLGRLRARACRPRSRTVTSRALAA